MNVFEKLQSARVDLQKMNLKKSGRNNYSNYNYYELSDFLPAINELLQKYKMTSNITFEKDLSILAIIDIEKPESIITFSVPFVTIAMKGANEVQNLGAVITYTRRYLYMNAFEIVESDVVDSKPLEHKIKLNKEDLDLLYFEFQELISALPKEIDEKDKVAILNISNLYQKGKLNEERLKNAVNYLNGKYIDPILSGEKNE